MTYPEYESARKDIEEAFLTWRIDKQEADSLLAKLEENYPTEDTK